MLMAQPLLVYQRKNSERFVKKPKRARRQTLSSSQNRNLIELREQLWLLIRKNNNRGKRS